MKISILYHPDMNLATIQIIIMKAHINDINTTLIQELVKIPYHLLKEKIILMNVLKHVNHKKSKNLVQKKSSR
jgi:hypothetical protein